VINASSTVLSKLFWGIVKITGNGLVIGDLIGRTFSAGCCIFRALKNDKEYFIHISITKMSELAKRYVEFPKLLLPGQLIDTINSQLATLMIAYFFFSRDVGYYGMAVNLISVPSSIIAIALMDVFRQRANEEWVKKGNCRIIYVKIVKTMFVVTVPASILLMIFLPDLFILILGEQWHIAGIYARILMPNVAILFMFQVVAAVFIIANKLKASLIWEVYSISLTLIFFLFGALVLKDMKKTLICYVIARSIANLTRFYLTYQYSKGDAN
jgi:O-antigen/teichoic acid export membrane protein